MPFCNCIPYLANRPDSITRVYPNCIGAFCPYHSTIIHSIGVTSCTQQTKSLLSVLPWLSWPWLSFFGHTERLKSCTPLPCTIKPRLMAGNQLKPCPLIPLCGILTINHGLKPLSIMERWLSPLVTPCTN